MELQGVEDSTHRTRGELRSSVGSRVLIGDPLGQGSYAKLNPEEQPNREAEGGLTTWCGYSTELQEAEYSNLRMREELT